MMNTTILVAVTDIFFYTKVRDALRPLGYVLERIRNQDEVADKAASVSPATRTPTAWRPTCARRSHPTSGCTCTTP